MKRLLKKAEIEQWTNERYKNFIREIQDDLDEDDRLSDTARDLLCTKEGLEQYIKEELGESNPINRLMNDLA
jgi:hypothetical protein